MFPRIEYLEWIQGRPDAALHDLAVSDLRGDRTLGTAVPDILSEYDDAPAGVSVETQLATLYGVDPDQVLVTAGASQANFVATAALIDEAINTGVGSPRLLVETPGYEPLVKTPEALGATVDRFQRRSETGYDIDLERVQGAIDDDTICVTVTNRHNPSGHLLPEDGLERLAHTVRQAGARLLVDEVYAPYVCQDCGTGPFGGPTAAGRDDVVITNSVTKCFGLGDIRIGWVIADREFIERARQVLAHVPTVAETSRALARRALDNADELTARARSLLADNNELLTAFVEEHSSVDGSIDGDASYGVLRHPQVDGDELAARAQEAGVLVVPGRFFGVSEAVRISVGRSPDDCAASLQAFGNVLETVSSSQ